MHRLLKNLVSLCAFSILLLLPLSAGELDSWFDSDSRAPAYASIRGELAVLAGNLESRRIPVIVLVDRLSEGSAKKVPAGKLLEALRKDSDDLVHISSLYGTRYPAVFGDTGVIKDFLVLGGLILRSGIERDDFESCLPRAGSDGPAVKRVLDALLAVASVHRRSPLGSAQIVSLTEALAASPEKPERFPALSSLFVRGRAGGLGQVEIAETVIGAFNRGSGFLQAENEISRRIK